MKRDAMERFLKELMRSEDIVTEFTPQLWIATVEKAVVGADALKFIFKNGTEITVR